MYMTMDLCVYYPHSLLVSVNPLSLFPFVFTLYSQTLLTISAVLCQDLSFATTQDALQHAMGTILSNTDIFSSLSYSSSVLKDISSLLAKRPATTGQTLAQHALADIHRLFGRGRTDLKSKKIGELYDV